MDNRSLSLKAPRPGARRSAERGEPSQFRLAALYLSPSMILLLALVILPMAYTLYLSLHKVNIVGGVFQLEPVALGNYAKLLKDPRFFPTLKRTLQFTFMRVGISILLGLAVALVLNEASFAAKVLKSLFLIPWALSFVVNGLMWRWMFNADYGVINAILSGLGIISGYRSWLGSTETALYAVTVADAWKAIPFVALVLLSGLQSIPNDLYEASKVDGAGILQRFRFITLPGLRPVLLVALVIQTMWSIKAFDIIWVVTTGGPMDSTMLLNVYAYQHSFMFLNLGYGSAIAYVITIIILLLTLAYLAILRLED